MSTAALRRHIQQINSIILSDKIDRAVLSTVHAEVAKRIFSEGKAADENYIGQYSESYLKQRQRNKWPASRKVILQATRQMVNDFSLIRIQRDHYGSGFKNNINGAKRKSVERTYRKTIFALTASERQLLPRLYEQAIKRYIR